VIENRTGPHYEPPPRRPAYCRPPRGCTWKANLALLEKERHRELCAIWLGRPSIGARLFLAGALLGGVVGACATGDDVLDRRPTTRSGLGGSNDGSGGAASTGGTQGPTGGTSGGTAGSSGGGSTGTGGSGRGGSSGAGGSTGTGGSSGTGGSTGSGGSPGGTGGSSTGTGGTPVNTGLPYTEDFEDGVANGWMGGYDDKMMPLGTWAVVTDGANKVYQEQDITSSATWAVGGDYRWNDQHLESKIKIVSGIADATVTLVVRFTDFKTFCFLEVRNNQMKIRVKVNGSTTDVVVYKFPTPLVAGTWYTAGISVKGTTLTAYYNGMPVGSGVNAGVASGGIALTALSGVIAFDDISVTLPP